MAEENIISVTNNENPPINLEIVSYKNEVGVSYIQGKGDKGDTGAKGETGAKGDKGDLGVSTMLVSSFTGAINGTNTTFVLNDNYDDVIVFINGIKYSSADYTYTKSTKTVVFSFAIPTGYALEFYGVTNKNAQVVPLQDLSTVATSGSYNDLLNKPSIPTKTSDLTNDSHFAVDANYVHTDNNLTNTLKSNYDTAYTNNHTHANSTALNNVSGTNTGDETASTIKSKLGITTLSGSNTGDQDLSGLVTKTTTVNGKALNSNVTVTATDTGAPTISSGTTAPSSTPAKVGDIYIDYTNKYVYKAMGSSAPTDWVKQSKFSETAVVYTGTAAPTTTPAKIGDVFLDTTNKKFYRANGSGSSSDWILVNGNYTLQASTASSISPADATTYFFGQVNGNTPGLNPYGSGSNNRMYITRAGNITKCYGTISSNSDGSSETSSLYIRLNNTTDYLVSNSIVNNIYQCHYSKTDLNIAVVAGDYVIMKWAAPTWVTNPTLVGAHSIINVEL